MTPELHRPLVMDRIGPSGLDITVEADTSECAALAARMRIPAIDWLSCAFHLARGSGQSIIATGHLRARVVQTCVISMEDFPAEVEERFRLRWVPAEQESDEIDPEDEEDEVVYVDGVLDLGEAAAEQLGLALDPYPRQPGAELPEIEAEAEPHPFDVLRRRH